MSSAVATITNEERALRSLGISDAAIYAAVRRVLREAGVRSGRLLDVGCGEGHLRPFVDDLVDTYIGNDIIRYNQFPSDAAFLTTDLDNGRVPVGDGEMDVVTAVEVIEHLENPRAFVRELARCTRPGGLIVVTTPNQLSGLSVLTLAIKRRHAAFQDVHYPAHISALLEIDLVRMASEAGLVDARIDYTHFGRIVLTSRHFPAAMARRFPRLLSENIVLTARKPE
ncbi:MAG: methyltransferase domain-containing protein [Blastocatellia bacterium]|nr:methyltransferase domain-containing protein [Blastocatellia bacterium]